MNPYLEFYIDKPVVLMFRADTICYFTGKLVAIDDRHYHMTNVTWHVQTGRHNKFMNGDNSIARETYPSGVQMSFNKDDVASIIGPWPGKLNSASK